MPPQVIQSKNPQFLNESISWTAHQMRVDMRISIIRKVFQMRTALPLLALCVAMTVPLQGRTLFLSTTGDDSAPYGDGAVFRTLRRATDSLAAGDTLIVRNGTYQGGLIVQLEGTAEAPIFIQGESLDAVISGSINKLDALRLDLSSYVTVDRLTARDADRGGIGVINCHHITITNGRFANNGKWGIFTGFADDIHFEGNECYGSRDEHGIYHSNSGDRFVIRGNIVHHNRACGIHMNGDPEMGGDGVLSYGIVEGNIIYENGQGGGAGINMTHVQDVIVRNNLIYNNYAGGFTYYQDTGTFEQGSKRALIMGNTVYFQRYQGRSCVNISDTSEKVLVAGNIFVSGVASILEVHSNYLSSILSDHNIFWGIDEEKMILIKNTVTSLSSWRSATGNDLHTIAADPGFVRLDSADFRPDSISPAIDIGMPLDSVRANLERLGGFKWALAQLDSLPDEDLTGKWRPVGEAPDAGAYESGFSCDFNRDGAFSVADAVALILLAVKNPGDPNFDLNGDGHYSITDVVYLILLLLKPA